MPAGSLGPTAMILHSIETPADVKGLNQRELAELCEEIRAFIVDTVTTTGGHLGSNLGAVELTLALHRVFDSPARRHPVGHRPPGLRAQAADRPALRLQDPQAGRRHVGLPEPGRVGARLDREQPRLDGALVRTRHRQRVLAARHRRRAPGGGRGRGRGADRWDGLRGPQQPGPLTTAGRDRAQRQRALLCADGVAALAEPDDAAAQPDLHRGARSACACACASSPPSASSPTRACTRSPARCARWWRRTPSSRHWASATPGRSTATTSSTWSRRSPTPPNGTAPSSSTC